MTAEALCDGVEVAVPPARRLRIAVLCGGSYVSGMELIELAIMRGLASRGHAVHCFASGWNDGDFPQRLADAGIPFSTVRLGKLTLSPRPRHLAWTLNALLHAPAARRAVRTRLAALQPDVVVACNRDAVLLLVDVLCGYTVAFHTHEAPDLAPRSRRALSALAKRVDRFVCVSEAVRARLLEAGLSEETVTVIYNGVEPREPARRREHDGPCTVGICGQIGSWKGHEDLLEAIGLLRSRGTDVRCQIIGDGPPAYVSALQQRAESLGVDHQIEWKGFVRDQDAIYRDLDVVIVPSRHVDPLPTVALEAGARGLPVIASTMGGLPEIVVDRETGLLVEAEAPHALAEAIGMLSADGEMRMRMGQAARKRVMELFAPERMIEEHEHLMMSMTHRDGEP
jgi:glycosyltransferase involved in cell wall biosynthesis